MMIPHRAPFSPTDYHRVRLHDTCRTLTEGPDIRSTYIRIYSKTNYPYSRPADTPRCGLCTGWIKATISLGFLGFFSPQQPYYLKFITFFLETPLLGLKKEKRGSILAVFQLGPVAKTSRLLKKGGPAEVYSRCIHSTYVVKCTCRKDLSPPFSADRT